MMKITRVKGREILDFRGNPTVEVEVTVKGDVQERARGKGIPGKFKKTARGGAVW